MTDAHKEEAREIALLSVPKHETSHEMDSGMYCMDCEREEEAAFTRMTTAIASALASRDTEVSRACPCLHTTPCHKYCTCINQHSSRGCDRCCTYGSAEQQRERAETLAALVDNTRDTEIREVLEGLRNNHGCWCPGSEEYEFREPFVCGPDCKRAQVLYEKVQPKEKKDGSVS